MDIKNIYSATISSNILHAGQFSTAVTAPFIITRAGDFYHVSIMAKDGPRDAQLINRLMDSNSIIELFITFNDTTLLSFSSDLAADGPIDTARVGKFIHFMIKMRPAMFSFNRNHAYKREHPNDTGPTMATQALKQIENISK